MKLSQSSFVYYRYPLEESIKRLAQYGYQGIEIWGGRCHAYYEDMPSERINAIKDLLKRENLNISNFIPAQFRYPCNLGTTQKEIRRGSLDYIKKNIDVANALGSPFASLCPGFSLYGERHEDAWQAMIENFAELNQYADDKNIMLLIEPAHPMETDLICTTDQAMKALTELNAEKTMGLCLDTGHLFLNKESLTDIFEKTKTYTVHFHIDDNNGKNDDHLVPGEGSIDFTGFLGKLKEHEYKGFLAAELGWNYTAEPDCAVIATKKFLEKV